MRAAARRLTALYDEALLPTGVNVAQFALLRGVPAVGSIAITDLASAVDLERSTVARNVRVLEKQGLVALDGSEKDKRTTEVRLTDKGRSALGEGAVLWSSAQRRLEERLGLAKAVELRALLASV